MKLPNADRAVLDVRKLRDYCLNPWHLRGRHKARLFREVLGLTSLHAELLRNQLLAAACKREARLVSTDEYGERYVLDSIVAVHVGDQERTARVRSLWIVLHGEDFPRFCSCYMIKKRGLGEEHG